MKINDLFETWTDPQKQARVEFELILSDTFDEDDADQVALKVADQSGGELDEYDPGMHYGKYFDDVVGHRLIEYRIISIPKKNISIPRKILRRLQRGKPKFDVRFFRAIIDGIRHSLVV
ncbi:hypothetical protein LCGC14_0879280 [marine sediment metagenome]|uniref:Uncharacterized protein n=1 Tax=marine sediment metagenome TaxID=412755 RepID=A0A0F9P2F4_9ZZZZ